MQRDRRLIPVGADFGPVGALRQLADFIERRLPAAFEDEGAQRVDAVHVELVQHLHQPLGAGVVAGTEGVDIPLQLDRGARARADEVEEGLVRHAAGFEAADDGDEEPFLEHRTPFGSHAEAADIDDMRGIGKQPDDLALAEGGGDDGEVVQMPGRQPGIIGDVVLPGLHGVRREFLQEMPDAFGHGVHMAGRAGHGLRQHPPLQVEDACGEIAGFAHRGAEGRADHGLRLFLDHRDQAVPLDLALDFGEGTGLLHQLRSCVRSRYPRLSIRQVQPGPTSVLVSASAMMQGPGTLAPGAMAARS